MFIFTSVCTDVLEHPNGASRLSANIVFPRSDWFITDVCYRHSTPALSSNTTRTIILVMHCSVLWALVWLISCSPYLLSGLLTALADTTYYCRRRRFRSTRYLVSATCPRNYMDVPFRCRLISWQGSCAFCLQRRISAAPQSWFWDGYRSFSQLVLELPHPNDMAKIQLSFWSNWRVRMICNLVRYRLFYDSIDSSKDKGHDVRKTRLSL